MIQRLILGLLTVLISVSLFGAEDQNHLTLRELAEGWILLWDGETSFGWEAHGVKPEWKIERGILTSHSGEDSWMITTSEFADFDLRADYRSPVDGNSGIFLRALGKGAPAQTGYEVQICDMHRNFPTGSLLRIKKARKVLPDPEAWHTMEIMAEGDHITVRLDGAKILDAHDRSYVIGHIGLQYNKGHEIEFRNIKIRPLGLRPLFNGLDLSGWNRVNRPDVKVPPEWSVREGSIHVEKGPGILETADLYKDFILQVEIRTNPQRPGDHPDSGIFVRGDRGRFWSGYELQIHNEFKEGDLTKPVDFGTGGIYNLQSVRLVIPEDGVFFAETIHIQERHLAVWINGIQVSDYTDLNREGMDVFKNQARLAAGTISLQAHDPSTNLDFRNIRLAALPED